VAVKSDVTNNGLVNEILRVISHAWVICHFAIHLLSEEFFYLEIQEEFKFKHTIINVLLSLKEHQINNKIKFLIFFIGDLVEKSNVEKNWKKL